MKAPHFLVFIGAGPSLSTELDALESQLEGTVIVAPAIGKHERGLTPAAVERAIAALVESLKENKEHREPARLSVWSYEPTNPNQFDFLWNTFGKSAWIELVPSSLINKDRPTRLHVQQRASGLLSLIHLVAHSVYNERKTSPFPLPFRNFKSKFLRELEEYWYRGADEVSLKRIIEKNGTRYRNLHAAIEGAHKDDRALLFKGARDTECHGQPHPTGEGYRCFVDGRFRFGAALFPGFHYDTRFEKGLLNCTLYDCRGVARDLKPEKRDYINIFPNDHLLPARV